MFISCDVTMDQDIEHITYTYNIIIYTYIPHDFAVLTPINSSDVGRLHCHPFSHALMAAARATSSLDVLSKLSAFSHLWVRRRNGHAIEVAKNMVLSQNGGTPKKNSVFVYGKFL